MKRFCFSIFILFFLGGAHSCIKSEEQLSQAPLGKENKDLESLSCQNNEDCTVIKADCCGCKQGGTQKAIAKASFKRALNEQKTRCEGIMCIQMISTDESCSKNSLCESGRCVLK